MNLVKKLTCLGSNFILFSIGFLAIFVLSYQFGWTLLVGLLRWGNDIPFALSYVFYLDRWLPYLPRWHYEWAGGTPFLQNYPLLITYLTAFIHRLSSLSIVQIARLFYWLSVPLAGVGILIFARLVLKNWLLAILAGLFFVLSPDSWLWITHGGFYAVQTSFPFMVMTFIFFELAWQRKKRIWWGLAAVFFGLTWLAHPITGMTQTVGLGAYGLGRGLQERQFLLGIMRPALIILVGISLVAFWVIPFAFSRPGGIGVGPHQVSYLTIKEFLGLAPPHDGVYVTSTFFAGAVLVLTVLGIVFSLARRKSLVWIFIAVTSIGLFIAVAPGMFPWLMTGPLLPLWALMNVRAAVLPRLFLPIIAAYGAISLGESPFLLIAYFWKRLRENLAWRWARKIIGGAAALMVVYLTFKLVIIIPKTEYFYLGYGPVYHWVLPQEIKGKLMINEGKDPLFPSIQESLRRLLTFSFPLDDVPLRRAEDYGRLAEKLSLSDQERIDIWPLGGDISAEWNVATGVSQIPSWAGGVETRRMMGYQQACFYNLIDPPCSNNEIQDLARWWGIKLVLIGETTRVEMGDEKLEASLKTNFQREIITLGDKQKFMVYHVPPNSGLASISNKPLILVVGDNPPQNDVFDTIFRSLNRFGFGYEKGLSIKGKRFVDDYTLAELANYPMVILHGYRYHNRDKAWSRLAAYVKNGGSLFMETGWQYMSQDWGKIDEKGQALPVELPEPLPVSQTKWGNVGTSWTDLAIKSDELGKEINSQDWAAPVWQGDPWGMALANPENLREFGQPLVTAAGKILVAKGSFGQGKIVWSGMNLFGHTSTYRSQAEDELLLALFSWLAPELEIQEEKLNFARVTPDKVVINLDKTVAGKQKVMFKESTVPGWEAYLTVDEKIKKLPILKTGPGWKLVLLPEGFGKGELSFVYQRTARDWLYLITSILTGLGLGIYLLDGILKGSLLNRLRLSKKNEENG